MNLLTGLLIVVLSQQGYWFGGREGTIRVQWPVAAPMPAATLTWDLMFGATRVGGGSRNLMAATQPTTFAITLPEVRVRTQLRWVYRVNSSDGKLLDQGSQDLQVFPAGLVPDFKQRLADKKLLVCDDPSGLPRLFESSKIVFERLDDTAGLQTAQADIIIVGPDHLGDSAFAQAILLDRVAGGAQALILAQTKTPTVAGYALAPRRSSEHMKWAANHPLLAGLEIRDWDSWLRDGADRFAIQLPADEPALDIVSWPRETPGKEPAPVDALLVVKAVGQGRLILCQLPVGNWVEDPRSQIFIRNALDYLLTRPEPTPRPSAIPNTQPVKVKPALPSILDRGDRP